MLTREIFKFHGGSIFSDVWQLFCGQVFGLIESSTFVQWQMFGWKIFIDARFDNK